MFIQEVIYLVALQGCLSLLYQLPGLFVMRLQLVLFPVDLGLNVVQPTVEVVLPEDVRNLFVILQSTLQVLLSLSVLLLQIPDITECRLATCGSQSTANHSKNLQGS